MFIIAFVELGVMKLHLSRSLPSLISETHAEPAICFDQKVMVR